MNSDGTKKGELRYKPWGETRYTWGTTPTSYRYTGQCKASAIGLYYYKARWYDSALGRFVQADTIVPGAGNPAAYDRYAYTLNNPVKYIDPSGHSANCSGIPSESARAACERSNYLEKLWNDPDLFDKEFGLDFTGTGWTEERKSSVRKAVWIVGSAFSGIMDKDPEQAIRAVYGNITFQWGDCTECDGFGGYTYGKNKIAFVDMYDGELRQVNNVIHELGHAFDWAVAGKIGDPNMPRMAIDKYLDTHPGLRRETEYTIEDAGFYGFASARNNRDWQMRPSGAPGEEFADTFLGWTRNAWEVDDVGAYTEDAKQRQYFMNPNMRSWLNLFK